MNIDSKSHLDGHFDYHTDSDMSVDEDVESMAGLESTFAYPRVIPLQVYALIQP